MKKIALLTILFILISCKMNVVSNVNNNTNPDEIYEYKSIINNDKILVYDQHGFQIYPTDPIYAQCLNLIEDIVQNNSSVECYISYSNINESESRFGHKEECTHRYYTDYIKVDTHRHFFIYKCTRTKYYKKCWFCGKKRTVTMHDY